MNIAKLAVNRIKDAYTKFQETSYGKFGTKIQQTTQAPVKAAAKGLYKEFIYNSETKRPLPQSIYYPIGEAAQATKTGDIETTKQKASELAQAITFGYHGGVMPIKRKVAVGGQKSIKKAYDMFTHDLKAASGDVTKKFKPAQIKKAVNDLASKLPNTGNHFYDEAIKIARYIKNAEAGMVVNAPAVGLSTADISKAKLKAKPLKVFRGTTGKKLDLGREKDIIGVPFTEDKAVAEYYTKPLYQSAKGGKGVVHERFIKPDAKIINFPKDFPDEIVDSIMEKAEKRWEKNAFEPSDMYEYVLKELKPYLKDADAIRLPLDIDPVSDIPKTQIRILNTDAILTKSQSPITKVKLKAKPAEVAKVEKKGFFGWFDEVRRRLENEYHPVEKVGQIAKKKGTKIFPWQDPEYLVKRNLGSTGIAEGELLGLGDIIRPHADDVDDLVRFLESKRALELSKRDIKTGIDIDDAQMAVAELGPKFEATAQKLYMYQRSVLHNYLVDTGMLSEEAFENIVKLNQSYVPFKRVFEEAGIEDFVPKKKITSPIKRIKGSERAIENPLESIIENTYKAVTVGEQNRLWRSVAQIGEQVPELGIEKLKPKMIPVAQVEGKNIFRPSFFNPTKNSISFFDNGKRVFYKVPKEVATVANSLGSSMNAFVKLLSYPTKFVRAGATGSNPEFALLRNPIRDQMSALWNSKTGYMPFLDMMKGISHFSGNDDLYRQYLVSGAGQSFMVSLDRKFKNKTLNELVRGNIAIRKGNLLSKLQDVSQITEIGTRLGEFGRGLKKYGEPLMAAKGAREVSVDFGRIGKDVRVANQLIAFLNARVQGTIQATKSAVKNPVRAGVLATALGAFPATLLYLHNKQYPEWYDIQDYEKENNWIVLHGEPGNAKMFEIPKDYIFGKLFGNAAENYLSYMDKANPDGLKKLAGNIGSFISPVTNIGEIFPTGVKPIVEHAFNYNTFLERPIVPEYQKPLPTEAQYNAGTREIAKVIGTRVGISPAVIDNYLYGYAPGLPTEVINLVDFALGNEKWEDTRKLPFVRVFAVSGTDKIEQEIKNTYYQIQDKKKTLSSIAKNKNYSEDQKKALIQKQLVEMQNLTQKLNVYYQRQQDKTAAEEKVKTPKLTYTPPGPVGKAEAADNIQETVAKEQFRYSDETKLKVGNTLYYKPEDWKAGDDIRSVSIDWTEPDLPDLKGKDPAEDAYAKKQISDYKSEIGKRQTEVLKLEDIGEMSYEDAYNEYLRLDELKKSATEKSKEQWKEPEVPTLKEGMSVSDPFYKKMVSKYKTKLSERQDELLEMYADGEISYDKAYKEYVRLEELKKSTSGGGRGRKVKIPAIQLPKTAKLKISTKIKRIQLRSKPLTKAKFRSHL